MLKWWFSYCLELLRLKKKKKIKQLVDMYGVTKAYKCLTEEGKWIGNMILRHSLWITLVHGRYFYSTWYSHLVWEKTKEISQRLGPLTIPVECVLLLLSFKIMEVFFVVRKVTGNVWCVCVPIMYNVYCTKRNNTKQEIQNNVISCEITLNGYVAIRPCINTFSVVSYCKDK